jgi:hypothetical protein
MVRPLSNLVVNSSGNSQSLLIPPGRYSLSVSAAGWGSANLQSSVDNSTFFNVTFPESGNDVSFTKNTILEVNGGLYFRLNISVYTNPITVTFTKIEF